MKFQHILNGNLGLNKRN